MIASIKAFVVAVLLALASMTAVSPALATVNAADSNFKADACKGVNALSSDTVNGTCTDQAGKVNSIIKLIINILSLIVGIVATIMVIIGGLKYITSNGDSGNTASAKNTVLYAIIGLVIVAVAQVLVHFVLFKTAKAAG